MHSPTSSTDCSQDSTFEHIYDQQIASPKPEDAITIEQDCVERHDIFLKDVLDLTSDKLLMISLKELQAYIDKLEKELPQEPSRSEFEQKCRNMIKDIQDKKAQVCSFAGVYFFNTFILLEVGAQEKRKIKKTKSKVSQMTEAVHQELIKRENDRKIRDELSKQWKDLRTELEELVAASFSEKNYQNWFNYCNNTLNRDIFDTTGGISLKNGDHTYDIVIEKATQKIKCTCDQVFAKYQQMQDTFTLFVDTENVQTDTIDTQIRAIQRVNAEISAIINELHQCKCGHYYQAMFHKFAKEQLCILKQFFHYRNENENNLLKIEQLKNSCKEQQLKSNDTYNNRKHKKIELESYMCQPGQQLERLSPVNATTNAANNQAVLATNNKVEIVNEQYSINNKIIQKLIPYLEALSGKIFLMLTAEDRELFRLTGSAIMIKRDNYQQFQLTHSMDIFDDFEIIGVDIPMNIGKIPETKEILFDSNNNDLSNSSNAIFRILCLLKHNLLTCFCFGQYLTYKDENIKNS
ncbi:hypothetical protein RFI_28560 [Reticulomyxa filosa]|uniref:Uncharacterized protein n=1 Tax=Reticulomyxa filosa TaxID=46433 RepID=X6M5C5_RETFI|nr:hypothetical protein RFI_28560 [Reticulomyxa filosa]|eukprot:ETO08826.1 hypothetical protein RFI_28560 [Reticulomyxa filosa]